MAAHSYTGLYYPFIHFKDDRWVKLAALYWDRMARIVPQHYTTEDSETVRSLGDFVESLPPSLVNPQLGETFSEFVSKNGAQLWQLYGVHLRDQWDPVPAEQSPPAAGGGSGTDSRLSYVFYEKISDTARRVMKASGLTLEEPSDPRWIGMHPRL